MVVLKSELILVDKMSKPLQDVVKNINATQLAFNNLGKSGGIFNKMSSDIERARVPITKLKTDMNSINGTKLSGAVNSVNNLTGATQKSIGVFRQLRYSILNTYIMLMAVKSTIKTIANATTSVDQFNRSMARLELVDKSFNGVNANIDTFYNKILSSSKRARESFNETAQQVSKLGLQAQHAFSGTDELIKFTELATKSFKIAGTTAESQRAAMHQLTQALASNRLQGEEFNSILENMPQLVDMLKKKLGTTHAELRKMASAGQISATVIKEAMFESAKEIEENFSNLPYTIGERFLDVSRAFQDAMRPVYQRLGELANSSEFIAFIEHLKGTAVSIAGLIMTVINGFQNMLGWIRQNKWALDLLGSSLTGILTILIAVKSISAFKNMLEAIKMIPLPLLAIIVIVSAIIFIARQMGYEWGEIFRGIANVVIEVWNIILMVVTAIIATIVGVAVIIANLVLATINYMIGVMYEFGAVIKNVWIWIQNLWGNVWTAIYNFFIDRIYDIEMGIYNLQVGWATMVANIKNAWGRGMNWLLQKGADFINGFIGLTNSLADSLNNSKLFKGINKVLEMAGKGPIEFGKASLVSFNKLSTDASADLSGITKPTKGKHLTYENKEFIDRIGEFNKGASTLEYANFGEAFMGVFDFMDRFHIDKLKGDEISGDRATGPSSGGITRDEDDLSSFLDDFLKNSGNNLPDGLGGGGSGGGDGSGGGGKGKSPNVGTVDKIKEPIKLSDEAMKLFKQIRDGSFSRGYATIAPNIYLTYTSNNQGSSDEAVEKNAKHLEKMILEELSTNLRLP